MDPAGQPLLDSDDVLEALREEEDKEGEKTGWVHWKPDSIWQTDEHPSPLTLLPSSQRSGPTVMASPQNGLQSLSDAGFPCTLGMHCQPSSTTHWAEHPSPERRLLSSHSSTPSVRPLPQEADVLLLALLLLPDPADDDARVEDDRPEDAVPDDVPPDADEPERPEELVPDDTALERLPEDAVPDDVPPELRDEERADDCVPPEAELPPPIVVMLGQFCVLMIFCHAHSYTWQPSP